jgi:tetratricopeptide (TPR) repeat protein
MSFFRRTAHWMAIAVLAAGCAKATNIEPTPKWKTPDGRRSALHEMAQWYTDNELPAQAMEMVERLRSEGAGGTELDLIYGRALMAAGVDDEARHVLEAVAESAPKDPRPLQQLGIIYSDAGEVDRAIEVLEDALEIDPSDTGTRNNLGYLLFAEGRCEESVPHLQAVIASEAMNPRYRNNLAFALVCVGQHDRALKLFRSTGPEDDARYNMGVAFERLDSLPSAFLQYQHALTANPKHELAQDALARLAPHGFETSDDEAPAASPDTTIVTPGAP